MLKSKSASYWEDREVAVPISVWCMPDWYVVGIQEVWVSHKKQYARSYDRRIADNPNALQNTPMVISLPTHLILNMLSKSLAGVVMPQDTAVDKAKYAQLT